MTTPTSIKTCQTTPLCTVNRQVMASSTGLLDSVHDQIFLTKVFIMSICAYHSLLVCKVA